MGGLDAELMSTWSKWRWLQKPLAFRGVALAAGQIPGMPRIHQVNFPSALLHFGDDVNLRFPHYL